MPIPLIAGAKIGIKKACGFIAGRAATARAGVATAARTPRAPTRITPVGERARTATERATAGRAAAVRAGAARGGAGRVRPPAKGKIDYRIPVYGTTIGGTALAVGAGVDMAGEGIRDVGAGIAKTAPALPWITVAIVAIVGLIGLKYFRRRM